MNSHKPYDHQMTEEEYNQELRDSGICPNCKAQIYLVKMNNSSSLKSNPQVRLNFCPYCGKEWK